MTAAVVALAVLAMSACSPGARDRAREIAVSNLVAQRERVMACFDRFVTAYPGDGDFTQYLGKIDKARCGNVEILNRTDAELERWVERADGNGWLPFRPGDQDTWFTSVTASGDTARVAVTSVGRGNGGNDKLPVLETVAVCWSLAVDLSHRIAEVVDDGECHEAVIWPDTEILSWEDTLDEHASHRR